MSNKMCGKYLLSNHAQGFPCLLLLALSPLAGTEPSRYRDQAREVTQYIQKTFWNDKSSLYAGSATNRAPDFMWGNGVMFSALAGATRHEPSQYAPLMLRFFQAMDRSLLGYQGQNTRLRTSTHPWRRP